MSILTSILDYLINLYSKKICNDFISIKRKELLYTIDNNNFKSVDNINIGTIIGLINNDIPLISNFFTYNIFSILNDVITAVFSICILIYIDYRLFFIVTILQILLIIFSKTIESKTEKSIMSLNVKNDFFNLKLPDILSKINYLILTNFYRKQANKLQMYGNKILSEEYNLEKFERIGFAMSSILQSIIMIVTYLYCGIKIINGNMTIGELLMFSMYSNRYINPIIRLVQMKVLIIQVSKSIQRVYGFINLEEDVKIEKKINIDADINFCNVSFSFNQALIFRNLNLCIKEKKINLIKGRSGSGKTTLIKLLLGILEVSSGEIYLGNENIRALDVRFLRDNISYISQKTEIFYDTIRNNINIDENENITDEEILSSLKSVGLEAFITKNKKGLDEMILSDGKNISGGEAQRLALCRAIIKNRKIIILDEVTANLDKKMEINIVDLISKNFKNKTVIIITHSNAFNKIADNTVSLV